MMLSIIIPMKNEEKYLPVLLESIRKQTFKDFEIIVADNASGDATRAIAERFGCRVTDGGLPAAGRNKGARIAKGEILLFLDADTDLADEKFLEKALSEFREKRFCVASPLNSPSTRGAGDLVFSALGRVVGFFAEIAGRPLLPGYCIFVKKDIHEKLGGFDEKLFLGEDTDYGLRASKISKAGVLHSVKIIISTRRAVKGGYFKLSYQYAGFMFYHYVLGREDKGNKFKYNFNIHENNEKK